MKLLFLGDRIWGTSAYSRIIYNLATRLLKQGHEVAHIPMAKALRGSNPYEWAYEGVQLYHSGDQTFGEDVAVPHYINFKADMLITVKEPWVFGDIYRHGINFVPMAIIDHSPVSAQITSRLHTAFRVIAVSRFGQRELRGEGIKSTYIPHGVNCDVYHRLSEEDRRKCRKMFYFDEDEFVVVTVALNRVRKMIPRMLRGYKRFLENNPDVKSHLMLWCDIRGMAPHEPTMGVSDVGVDLLPEIINLDLSEPIRWPARENVNAKIPDWLPRNWTGEGWDMVKLLNCADVNLLASGGEAAGLPYIEAAACGVPSVGTKYAGAPEYIGPGIAVEPDDYEILSSPGTRFMKASIDGIADALTKLMNGDREKQARRARRHAERYDWDRIVDRYFNPFLEDAEKELYPKITAEGVSKW